MAAKALDRYFFGLVMTRVCFLIIYVLIFRGIFGISFLDSYLVGTLLTGRKSTIRVFASIATILILVVPSRTKWFSVLGRSINGP